MNLRWTRRALQDLQHLHAYISQDDPEAAGRMVFRIQEAAHKLKQHSHMGKPGRVDGTRELVLAGSPYLLVYLLSGDEIHIVAVIHTSRRWPDSSQENR